MKKLLLVLGVGLFGITGVNAQTESSEIPDDQVIEKKYDYEKEKDGYTLNTETTYKGDEGYVVEDREIKYSSSSEPKSKAGEVISTVGSGAKAVGKGVKNAGSWTWDKIKHNKLTKNLFNQDEESAAASAQSQQQEPEATSKANQEVQEAESELNEAGEEAKGKLNEAGEEIKETGEEAKGELNEAQDELQDSQRDTEMEKAVEGC